MSLDESTKIDVGATLKDVLANFSEKQRAIFRTWKEAAITASVEELLDVALAIGEGALPPAPAQVCLKTLRYGLRLSFRLGFSKTCWHS